MRPRDLGLQVPGNPAGSMIKIPTFSLYWFFLRGMICPWKLSQANDILSSNLQFEMVSVIRSYSTAPSVLIWTHYKNFHSDSENQSVSSWGSQSPKEGSAKFSSTSNRGMAAFALAKRESSTSAHTIPSWSSCKVFLSVQPVRIEEIWELKRLAQRRSTEVRLTTAAVSNSDSTSHKLFFSKEIYCTWIQKKRDYQIHLSDYDMS